MTMATVVGVLGTGVAVLLIWLIALRLTIGRADIENMFPLRWAIAATTFIGAGQWFFAFYASSWEHVQYLALWTVVGTWFGWLPIAFCQALLQWIIIGGDEPAE